MASVISESEQHKYRRIATVIFLAVTVLFFVAFNFTPIPSQEYADRAVEALMLERIVLEPLVEAETEESEEDPEQPEETPILNPTQDNVTENLDLLMEAFDDSPLFQTEVSDLTTEERRDLGPADQKDLGFESTDVETAFGGQTLDLTSDLVKRDDNRQATNRVLRSPLLSQRRPSSRESLNSRLGLETGSDRTDNSDLDLREANRSDAGLLDPVREGESLLPQVQESDYSLPTDELVNWMRANQAPLDPGVRSLFQYSLGNLTANQRVVVNGVSYGLQLMHAPGGGETHIAIIDGEEIFYFIDLRMQQRASRFEKGTVRLDGESRVIVVESEDLSARSEEAFRAFKLFIDWWAEQRKELDSDG